MPIGTNLLTFPEAFDNAAWTKTASTATANAATAADGTTTADKLVESATTAVHFFEQIPSLSNNTQYVASVFAQKAEREALSIWFADTGWPNNAQTFFDLANGVILSNTNQAAGIEDIGGGIYRCWAVQTTAESGTRRVRFMLLDDITTPVASYAGNGTSGLYLWGAKLEAGSTPTAYEAVGGSTIGFTREGAATVATTLTPSAAAVRVRDAAATITPSSSGFASGLRIRDASASIPTTLSLTARLRNFWEAATRATTTWTEA